MNDKIKVKVSSFVANILEIDALRFGFTKNGKSNKNGLLNKLIPTLVEVRKERRSQIENILKTEYNRADSENIYSAVNTVIDRVYFNDENLGELEESIWIRPSKENISVFDEIETSEIMLTAQELSVYIRGLLNEYCMLPLYKRETLVFDGELDVFSNACCTHRILYFRSRSANERHKVFAFDYFYGYWTNSGNYCIFYDLGEHKIMATPLYDMQDVYLIKQKFKPSERLIERLQAYCDECDFEAVVSMEGERDVL